MAASNYDACLSKTLTYEGGYVNHPRDPGGATNYGITIAVARKHWKSDATAEDMKKLPLAVAKAIYRNDYWDKVNGDALTAGPDLCNFDYAVNSGVSRANKLHASMPNVAPVDYVKAYCKKRMAFLQGLSTWGTFGKGWTNRVTSVEAVGVKMALQAAGKTAEDIKSALKKEANKASATSKTQASAGAATAGGTATQAPELPDASSLDLSTTAGIVVAGAAVACVFGYFAYRAYVNHNRAAAYNAVAKET